MKRGRIRGREGTAMGTGNGADPAYVMGRSPEERNRLQQQSRLYNPAARRLFEREKRQDHTGQFFSGQVDGPHSQGNVFTVAWKVGPELSAHRAAGADSA